MAQLYDRPVHELFREMVKDFTLDPGETFSREEVLDWFQKRYPKVKTGTLYAHLNVLSTNVQSRIHHHARSDGKKDLLFRIDPTRYRLFDAATDPSPYYVDSPPEDGDDGNEEPSQFAYESDLRDFLAKNLGLVEEGLTLFEDGDVNGTEFPVGGRFIDILAIDRNEDYCVLELKVSRGYDRVIGQLLRYVGWIEKHQAEPGQKVRGIIIAKEISDDLRLACRRISDIDLFEYNLAVSLRRIES